MARGDLLCPIDNKVLGLPNPQLKGAVQADAGVGGHMHLVVDVTLTCGNGHRWHVTGELLAERTL